ncbi:hypothetical protein IC229_27650 [Spirosoma sp. BT702]|uniref:Uncharacterized protein n=1 Tax=Spirosoma profusum TaxID=2771354 RepID=A0A926Y3S9_9BACT|nr:hypothetical protein [Spirosoma profusum]MBD2704447.1 hypothetical protein [Spirosoma profusum]
MFLKITRGGQTSPLPQPTEFVKLNKKRSMIERMKARHRASRDEAIDRERAKEFNLTHKR